MIVFDSIALKVLSEKQQQLLPLLEDFSRTHFLVGGTAIALQLWHRKSIDFDFINDTNQWSLHDFKARIELYGFSLERSELEAFYGIEFEDQQEFHMTIHGVRFSTFNYFRTLYNDQKIAISSDIQLCSGLSSVSLEQLLCMKLFACISRNKWKDAVDIYFILDYTDLDLSSGLKLCQEKYFINIFSSDSVLEQFISWDWDITESVEYLVENPPSDKQIIDFLRGEAKKLI